MKISGFNNRISRSIFWRPINIPDLPEIIDIYPEKVKRKHINSEDEMLINNINWTIGK